MSLYDRVELVKMLQNIVFPQDLPTLHYARMRFTLPTTVGRDVFVTASICQIEDIS